MRMVNRKSIIGLMLFVIGCTGCGKKIDYIPETINIILNNNGVHSAKINRLNEYSRCKLLNVKDVEISDSVVREYIDIQVESHSQLVEVVDREEVQNGDVVIVSYEVIWDKKVINQVVRDVLMVGSGKYDQQFEEALIDQRVGNVFEKELESPNGEKMLFIITIESINCFQKQELTDEFVREYMGVDTIEAYYEMCRDILIKEKLQIEKEKQKIELWKTIANECKFSLDPKEVAEYSLQYVEMQRQMADVYGMDLDTYIKSVLGKSKTDFYDECYESGELDIKKHLLIGAIFSDLRYQITENEVELMCEKLGYEIGTILEDEYTYALVKYAIMEEKVIAYYE